MSLSFKHIKLCSMPGFQDKDLCCLDSDFISWLFRIIQSSSWKEGITNITVKVYNETYALVIPSCILGKIGCVKCLQWQSIHRGDIMQQNFNEFLFSSVYTKIDLYFCWAHLCFFYLGDLPLLVCLYVISCHILSHNTSHDIWYVPKSCCSHCSKNIDWKSPNFT